MNALESQFHEDMLHIYHEASELGYRPSYFLRMVQTHGGLEAARILLDQDAPTDGFTKLWELGRLDLSVEAFALRLRYQSLFSSEQLAKARERLNQYGYAKESQ